MLLWGMTAQTAYVQTVALCLCLCWDVIYKVILKLNHVTLNIPATLHTDTHKHTTAATLYEI